jgi:hypothetical protein
MKLVSAHKAQFGRGKFSRLKAVKFLHWENVFEVRFDDGRTFLQSDAAVRRSNGIVPEAKVVKVELDSELRHGFFVRYDNGQSAEVSWAFVRELPPGRKCGRR